MKPTRYTRREPRGNYKRTETLLKVARCYIRSDSESVSDYARVVESGFWCSQDRGTVRVYRMPCTLCGEVLIDGTGRYSLTRDTGANIAGLEWVTEGKI